ncbi:MAG: exonuclease SbcC [Alphaproteobacteria bacterium]|nr:exonuclease SbcC [Alphaproteobacteria bacterium]
MKPVRLTIQAFGPYPEREVIDFREAVDAGLFGIYGQTGSGKSTIFCAITFALFGEPAKTDQEAPSLRSDHADPGTQTEVEFVFDIGGQRFAIVRRPEQMRPKQRGGGETRSAHEAFLFDSTGLALDDIREGHRGKILAEKKVRDVDMAVANILGYGPEQFRQIVLLPQGRFETFLSAKTKERLDILRELFDVSLYGSLMARLKADAEAAERDVRDERAVCVGRLTVEGFESTDALAGGITSAESHHTAMQEIERAARVAFDAAQEELQKSETIEARFKVAESTRGTLAALLVGKSEMDTLAERVARAECARSLIDVEGNVTDAKRAVGEAGEKLDQAQKAANGAGAKEQAAADALKCEADRMGEIDALRQQVEEFDRHQSTLEKSSGVTEALNEAQALEHAATVKIADTRLKLAGSQAKHREKSDGLKLAHQKETRRQEIAVRLATINPAIAASESYEKAQKDVQAAIADVTALRSRHEAANHDAVKARVAYEDAEQSLSAAQALHLASKLEAGEPCPVCGALEHPTPATGAIEHAGREAAFREAKATWEKADVASRAAEQKVAGAEGILRERGEKISGLMSPVKTSLELKADAETERRALLGLGTATDIAEAEAEIERLHQQTEGLEKEREALQKHLSERQKATASEMARLEEMLAAVPEALRDGNALAAARETAAQSLVARQAAKEKAEVAAATTREAALTARKDRETAENNLSIAQGHHRKTIEILAARLAQAGLSDQDFLTLKPFIATIDQDRAKVEEHRRKLENAREAVDSATEALQQQTRPDLPAVTARRTDAATKLSEATDLRSAAWHRLDHLVKLRDSLADTLRRLDDAEGACGPLRELAGMVNGSNSQRLDLETFAIGAMFDQVLEAANLRLGPMTTSRYRMQRDLEGGGRGRRGLGIEVFDFHTGKARPTTTLSGGETFIAALALALGLADVVECANGKVRLDTIFIDEGFGSLDAESGSGTLDKVLEVLNALVSQNRAVGLISHVPLVQEAIPNGFYVRKHLSGSSVEARGMV